MKGGKKEGEAKKYLYAEPKFMVPPDAIKLPEPFKNLPKKEEIVKKTNWDRWWQIKEQT